MTSFYAPEHTALFRKAEPGKWPETKLNVWLGGLDLPIRDDLKEQDLSREWLISFRHSLTDEELFWLVLAWGRIRPGNARRVQAAQTHWLRAFAQAREAPDRAAAYAAFHRVALETVGMGPAYFTKLLFFADPAARAYIMDQWTARSVNLLLGTSLIRMMNRTSVCKRNPPETYEAFCRTVEHLADLRTAETGQACSGEHIEMCLFSTGGRGRAAADWRQHVRSR